MSNIRAGMTKDQVITVLGRPDGFAQSGATEALTYSNRLMSGFSWDRADYHVMLSIGSCNCLWSGNSSTKQRARKHQDARSNSDTLIRNGTAIRRDASPVDLPLFSNTPS